MSEPARIHIIGLGVSATARLRPEAVAALAEADWVLGSERQLNVVEPVLTGQRTRLLPALADLAGWIDEQDRKGTRTIAVLASGDPLYYGIGGWFSRHFAGDRLSFYPAVSSLQAACHAMGVSLQDVEVLSLHGRPLAKIRTRLKRNARLLILTDKHSMPPVLARECLDAGFGESTLTVCEALGYPHQAIRTFSALALAESREPFDPLHVTLVQVRGQGGVLPEFPGIPDQHFVTDGTGGQGMLTKRETRLAILSLLQPGNDEVIWDIGAGCGSVAVELAYWRPASRVFAIEHHEERLVCLEANRQRFGVVSNLEVVAGRAPAALANLPAPDKVFIGGSGGEMPELLRLAWQRLPDHGVLVVSAVMETTKHQVLAFAQEHQELELETLQIAVSKGAQLAGQRVYRPSLPVTLFRFTQHTPTHNRSRL